ncbi:MAG: PIN domain-containing protein [Syntrophobacteraceae bacterium]
MYVILDTNIWISELGLNSTLGAAVRFFIKNKGATLVVPEVIRLETERHLRTELAKYVTELQKNYRQLLAIFGTLKELVLPDNEAIEAKVAAVFGDCRVDLLEIPLTIESARSSFFKTIEKTPPSDKDQQFKDGVIWAECLNLASSSEVYLVTGDKAFYKGRQYEQGLADALISEKKGAKNAIYVFATLSGLLDIIRTEVKFDEAKLVTDFWESSRASIDGILARNSFAVSGPPIVEVKQYVTEDPNRLYVEFRISYDCEDLTDEGRTRGRLLLKGDCYYVVEEKAFGGFRNQGEELEFKTREGEDKSQRNVFLYADGLVIGHKSIEHSTRYPIEG